MKQKFFLILALVFLLILLVGLNSLSYVQKEKLPDTEDNPNRSTYNVGATGTRAFYDLLAETGHKVKRWQEPFPNSGETQFSTFVIIGKTRREFEQKEIDSILTWVAEGGKLVIIDRSPKFDFIQTTADWTISQKSFENSTFMTNPSNQSQMVGDTAAIKPIQPTLFTTEVNAVQPSQFAPSITIKRDYYEEEIEEGDDNDDLEEETAEGESELNNPTLAENSANTNSNVNQNHSEVGFGTGNTKVDELFGIPAPTEEIELETPTYKGEESGNASTDRFETDRVNARAPVIHLADTETNLLVDYPYDSGQIVYLSDPYIVANGGINLVDNARLAVNIVASNDGMIAFDEYHQGFGRNDNRLFEYLTGTPIIALFLQVFLIIGLIMISQSRRFARALPNDEPDRLSKLEYVSAMAQLQGRTKAFDLAIENIYSDFRRRVSRLVGIDNHTAKRQDIAEKIAERTDYNAEEIAALMFQCEDIIHGEPTKKKETVKLISRLREVENALGLRRGKNRRS